MVREIGSEFEWMPGTAAGTDISALFSGCDGVLTFSGRGALEQILKDCAPRRKAALPAYCCDSMIGPFLNAGAEVCFYPVGFDGRFTADYGAVPEDCDILLWMRYFGFSSPEPPAALIRRMHGNGGVILEDCTHSLMCKAPCLDCSDYAAVSLRKWFALLSGGAAWKRNGTFGEKTLAAPPDAFVSLRLSAMRAKRAYLDAGQTGDKQAFLTQYGEANEWLRAHYAGLGIDAISAGALASTDLSAVRAARRRNAAVLYEGLKSCPGVEPLFELGPDDCPLFVPVFLETAARDALRRALIRESVYCPVHWPRPEGCVSALYDGELSLICDQRYDEEDMLRIIGIMQKAAAKGYKV